MTRENLLVILATILLCATPLTADTPRGTTATAGQIAPVPPNSAQAALPDPVNVEAQGRRVTGPMGLAPLLGAKPTGARSGEECPPEAAFGQIPHGPDDAWSFAISAVTNSFTSLVQENFSGANGGACEIYVWGLSLFFHPVHGWFPCDPGGVTFDIVFCEDAGGAPGAAVCTYTGVTPSVTATGLYFLDFEMYHFEVLSLAPCCALTDGWVSIQSQANASDCAFLWASSPEGDGDSLQDGASTFYDRALCLAAVYIPQYGACCDDYTGVCEDGVEIIDCDGRFAVDTLCDDLDPPCGTLGACCVDLVCEATTYEADCDGDWYEGETCPEFECPDTDADFIVQAPFTSELRDVCGEGNDCALRSMEEHEYEVIIPYAGLWNFNTCLNDEWDTYIFLGTDLCTQDLGYNDDSCGLQSEIEVYLEPGNYFCTIEGYNTCGNYVFDVYDATPFGACCVGLDCVGDMDQASCNAEGGTLYEGQTCDEFECPTVPDNDLCENAELINAPYPVTVIGDNTLAMVACPGLLDWIAIWYEIELPYEDNTLAISLCPTEVDLYTAGIVVMDDCACDDYIIRDAGVFTYTTCPGSFTGYDMMWISLPGPGTILFPAYLLDAGGAGMEFEATFNVSERVPCVVECPPGAVEEQEPCGSDANGGCNMADPTFEPIECNTTLCGTGWFDGSTRDTDWFELVTAGQSILTISLEAEFDALFGPIGQYVDGVPGCDNTTGSVDPYGLPGECEPMTLVTECLPAGTYYIFVAPQFTNIVDCPADYVLTVECEPCLFLGACCYEWGGEIRCVDNEMEDCDSLGGDWYPNEDCATFDCPWDDCIESTLEITILTDNWGSETSWELTDHATGMVICSGAGYGNNTMYYEMCCIDYDACVDFTIYDSYGDGIYAPGGYIVTLDDVEIANTMGGLFTGSMETVRLIGGGCPAWACCVDEVCVDNTSPTDCAALGGLWYEGETCPDFACMWWYCTPCYSDPDDDYISNVTFNTIDNDTGPEGAPCSYSKYWDMSTEVELEETYQVSVSVDGNGNWTQYVSVWFDWDHNGQFETAHQLGHIVIDPGFPQTITGDITIPADADLGDTCMRVIERYGDETTDPCEEYIYGEAEDYWVVVLPGICGDFDNDGDVDVDDFYVFLDAFGTCDGDAAYEEDCDLDGDECITLVDYQMWTQCYRDAND